MTDEPATTPAADRVTALTLRCGQLREQRDEARRQLEETRRGWERDTAVRDDQRDRAKAAADALEASFRVEVAGLTHQRDEARQERDEVEERRAWWENTCVYWSEQAKEAQRFRDLAALDADLWEKECVAARAQAVQATTDADDLRARIEALHRQAGRQGGHYCRTCCDHYGSVIPWPCPTIEALDGADSSASVDPSATPDLLGPQIGAEQ